MTLDSDNLLSLIARNVHNMKTVYYAQVLHYVVHFTHFLSYEKHFCEIILNLDQWFSRRCRFKHMSYSHL